MARVSIIPVHSAPPKLAGDGERPFLPDLESEITTRAAWCQVKRQQRQPLESSIEDCEEDVDEWTEECTNRPTQLSGGSGNDPRKTFLDRLAELLCRKKDAPFITSTALIYNEDGATIVAARNSSSSGQTWSEQDKEMLEYLAELLERFSSDDIFDADPVPILQEKLVEYYRPRIRHHAETLVSLENGKTGMNFFQDSCCGGLGSGRMDLQKYAKTVEVLSHSTEFYTNLKTRLTPAKLRRVVDELAFIRRPMQGADSLLYAAQQCSGFRNTKIILLESPPPRTVEPWRIPDVELAGTPRLVSRFHQEVKKPKHIHAEMLLMTYLLDSTGVKTEAYPYLGVSKKTCLLCGHMLQALGHFETRANHGKYYSQWTLPASVWDSLTSNTPLHKAIQRLREVLLNDTLDEEVVVKNAEKESMRAAPIAPRHETRKTIFNEVVLDPVLLSREAEWLGGQRKLQKLERGDRTSVNVDISPDSAGIPTVDTEASKTQEVSESNWVGCNFCKATLQLSYTCPKCQAASYCNRDCYCSGWPRHKFSCALGRPIDATDHLVVSCHENEFPQDNDVARTHGFMFFVSPNGKRRLFRLYCKLVVDWKIDEDELRSAVKLDKLREMLVSRCRQTSDPAMLRDGMWLNSCEAFGANSQGPGFHLLLKAAQKELLSLDDRRIPIMELQPLEKRRSLVFYTQIRNELRPDVYEDNWIYLGLCTAPNVASEDQLISAYQSLIARCSFKEFWIAMTESGIPELFVKYGLENQVSSMRKFRDHMLTVKQRYPSVWELKRFTRMNWPDPMRSVVTDYGFMNCETAHERMQLRKLYQEYFERGGDEVRLHEACVAGGLAPYLRSVLGSLTVAPELLSNFYPLENYPMMGMVMETHTSCKQSERSQICTFKGDDEQTTMTAIPDDADEAMNWAIHERSAFLGTGLRKRFYSGPDGKHIQELAGI